MASARSPDGLRPPHGGWTIAKSTSAESLDIRDILAGFTCENLLSLPLDIPSVLDDCLSFDDIPCFPSDAKPKLFINAFDSPALPSSSRGGPMTIVTIPTGPRVRGMLMEPICVEQWAGTISSAPPPNHIPWCDNCYDEDDARCFQDPANHWTAEGSIVNSEHLKAEMSRSHPERSRQPPGKIRKYQSPISPTDQSWSEGQCNLPVENHTSPDHHSSEVNNNGIHVSGSAPNISVPTIMVSSSTAIIPLSLESSQSLARVPLAVRRGHKVPTPLVLKKTEPQSSVSDPYPDIPTPFLGSPSSSTPTFDFASNSPASSMGLEAMCAALRQRCPEVRSPPACEMQAKLESGWGGAPPSKLAEISADLEDEWQFAQDLMARYGDKVPCSLDDRVPQTPPQCAKDHPQVDEDSPWGMSPTLTNADEPTSSSSCNDLRQMRRKTVIIETPSHGKVSSLDIDSDKSYDNYDDHKPLPFDSPSDGAFCCATCQQSTPIQSRPSSSASMRPVKGILKVKEKKKSVRISDVPPSRHEYPSEGHESEVRAHPSRSDLPMRSAMSARQSSPLRQSFFPGSYDTSPESTTDSQDPESLPKHPALRTIARGVHRPTSPQTPTVTPAIFMAQQRAPLQSLNARQSLPAKRNSSAVYTEQGSRKSVTKADVGRPKRLMKTASTPISAGIENVARRESSTSRSRMPVPFRSILTKLRA